MRKILKVSDAEFESCSRQGGQRHVQLAPKVSIRIAFRLTFCLIWVCESENENIESSAILNYSKQPGNIFCLSTFRLHVGSLHQD